MRDTILTAIKCKYVAGYSLVKVLRFCEAVLFMLNRDDLSELSLNYDLSELSLNYDLSELSLNCDLSESSLNYDLSELVPKL